MESKLTVRAPRALIDRARRYAARHDTTLTRLVTSYLRQLPDQSDGPEETPLVAQLTGIIAPDLSAADYSAHIEDKYGVARDPH